MKRNSIILMLTLLLTAGLAACSNDDSSTDDTLVRTTWKLVGFYTQETGTLQVAEPAGCDDCYVISFLQDGIVNGKTSTNKFEGRYIVSGELISFKDCSITEVNEMYDGERFFSTLIHTTRFSVLNKQLRLYCNNEQDYLLFKQR
ncbi:MAG: META domain-containing protein [Prevotella sp.]|nr:META domain-containing protein [Prevotella sp.]